MDAGSRTGNRVLLRVAMPRHRGEWTVHDGHQFARNVLTNDPRAPQELRFVKFHKYDENFEPRHVSRAITNPVKSMQFADAETQTPAMGQELENEFRERCIRELIRRELALTPARIRRGTV